MLAQAAGTEVPQPSWQRLCQQTAASAREKVPAIGNGSQQGFEDPVGKMSTDSGEALCLPLEQRQ
eukprot:9076298-Karenia_brevis.AAC.1